MIPKPRVIAFYLPQYHPIPENDRWWGKGFTDWKNVVSARPRFWGHYQPHLPADLGFYDLRLEELRIAQAVMAREHGITGFCYYHYWFNGKMLLERPFNEVLTSGKPDFPFCLCWANENWTRRWDGLDRQMLIEQDYLSYDVKAHFRCLEKAFFDERYLKINGKPLFLIYSPNIPHLREKINCWRELARGAGLPGFFLCSMVSIHNNFSIDEILGFGFDAAVDFLPNGSIMGFREPWHLPKHFPYRLINKLVEAAGLNHRIKKLPAAVILDYRKIARYKISQLNDRQKSIPCVIPSWDNSPRRVISHVIQNEDPDIYQEWLATALKSVRNRNPEEQLVFINAWNEWAEGCHLEPDVKNGKKFLTATFKAVSSLK